MCRQVEHSCSAFIFVPHPLHVQARGAQEAVNHCAASLARAGTKSALIALLLLLY